MTVEEKSRTSMDDLTKLEVQTDASPLKRTVKRLIEYKKWANQVMFDDISNMPAFELTKTRLTNFGNILHTINHVYVVDDIFKHHLSGISHAYTSRNTPDTPALDELRKKTEEMDLWYLQQVTGWSDDDINETIEFRFVDGSRGSMTRHEIITHIVNHGSYHRGFVSDMMYQAGVRPSSNDFSVFATAQ